MTDNLKPEDRRRAMKAVRGKGTSLERRLFSMLAGLRQSGWKKSPKDVTGKPDVVFNKELVAIFVDGCFWHGCPSCQRKIPQTNSDYWVNKIKRNKVLARRYNRELRSAGWIVIRIWEHELKTAEALEKVRHKIQGALSEKVSQL